MNEPCDTFDVFEPRCLSCLFSCLDYNHLYIYTVYICMYMFYLPMHIHEYFFFETKAVRVWVRLRWLDKNLLGFARTSGR